MQVVCSSAYPVTRYRRKAAVLAFRLFKGCPDLQMDSFAQNESFCKITVL